MRVRFLKQLGAQWTPGSEAEVPDDVARQLIADGLAGELPDPQPGGVQSSDILVPRTDESEGE